MNSPAGNRSRISNAASPPRKYRASPKTTNKTRASPTMPAAPYVEKVPRRHQPRGIAAHLRKLQTNRGLLARCRPPDMKRSSLYDIILTVAAGGLEIFERTAHRRQEDIVAMCKRLLRLKGEASSISLAHQ